LAIKDLASKNFGHYPNPRKKKRPGQKESQNHPQGRRNLTSSQENKNNPSKPDFSKISLKAALRLLRKHPEKFKNLKPLQWKVPEDGFGLHLPDESLKLQALWQKMPVK